MTPKGPFQILYARNLFSPEALGGNRYPLEVTRRLAARGHTVVVLTSEGSPPYRDTYPWAKFITYPHPTRGTARNHVAHMLGAWRALRQAMAADVDVALFGSYEVAAAALVSRVLRNSPTIFVFHSELYSDFVVGLASSRPWARFAGKIVRRYVAWMEHFVLTRADAIVPVSQFSRSQILVRAPEAHTRIALITNGVDTAFYRPLTDRSTARRTHGFDPDLPMLSIVCRLAPVKRVDAYLKVGQLLRRQGHTCQLLVIGDGPERGRLETLAAALGLNDLVRFVGHVQGEVLRDYMQLADVQVCASEFENRSLAIMEGLSCGVPVVGTPSGGTPELLQRVDPRLVAASLSPEALAQSIVPLLEDEQLRQQLGQRARQVVEEEFDWQQTVEGLEALIDRLVAGTA